MKIKLSEIKPSPKAIRNTWEEEGLEELARSIKENGLIVPIKVRPVNGKYELVYGHRRVKALRRAGIDEAEAVVEAIDDISVLLQALIENVQREDMNPIDIAKTLFAIQEETGWSQKEMGRHGIMPAKSISRSMALLQESSKIQSIVESGVPIGHGGGKGVPLGKVTPSHVTEVRESGLDQSLREDVIEKAAREGLTANQTRRVADSLKVAESPKRKKHLLKTEFSPLVHDAGFHKDREKKYGQHDPMFDSNKPTSGQEWDKLPEVANILAYIRNWRDSVKEFRQATAIGKLAPEARQFLAHKLKPFVKELNAWIGEMEG